MNTNRIPIAWLPADTFSETSENKFLDLFTDLISTGPSFKVKLYTLNEDRYELAVEVSIVRSSAAVEISLQASKRLQNKANVAELERRSYKRNHPTSTKWTRTMAGTPAAHMVSNHLFSGIKHLIGFDTGMWFSVSAESNQGQKILDDVLSKNTSLQIAAHGGVYRF
jgi:hypothetical protein